MSTDLQLVIIGGVIGIVGALLGAALGAFFDYWLQEKREKREKRQQNLAAVMEWAATGRKKNLRRSYLFGCDLRGVDLNCGPEQERGADLSYSDLRNTDLSNAQLIGVDLRGADMRGAKLTNTNLSGALLIQTNLSMTNLGESVIDDANLYKANLLKASVTLEKLKRAQTFDKAVLPTGNVHNEDESDE
jgi:uncharacterized protein YjbI with pentapeptide repeats